MSFFCPHEGHGSAPRSAATIDDSVRPLKTPVDGGTFDVNADGEVIIPINAKVKALNPQAFAITMEKPGGVMVSEQKEVAAIAKRET